MGGRKGKTRAAPELEPSAAQVPTQGFSGTISHRGTGKLLEIFLVVSTVPHWPLLNRAVHASTHPVTHKRTPTTKEYGFKC